jgi:hypothetical protein
VGVNPRLLQVMAAEPQFHAPAQFARHDARGRSDRPRASGGPGLSTMRWQRTWALDGGDAERAGPRGEPARLTGLRKLSRCRASHRGS